MWEKIELFMRALVIAIALESLVWALFPAFMRRLMARVLAEPDSSLRAMGISGLVLAAILAFFVTSSARGSMD